jgi:hypothetical protein
LTHQDIHYQDREVVYGGSPVTPTWADDRQSFQVPSICPACSGAMIRTVQRGLPTGSKGIWRRPKATEPSAPEQVTLVCRCGYPHVGRPPESTETGCGAVWKVPLA